MEEPMAAQHVAPQQVAPQQDAAADRSNQPQAVWLCDDPTLQRFAPLGCIGEQGYQLGNDSIHIEWNKITICGASHSEHERISLALADGNEQKQKFLQSICGRYYAIDRATGLQLTHQVPLYARINSKFPADSASGSSWSPKECVLLFYEPAANGYSSAWWVCHPACGVEGAKTTYLMQIWQPNDADASYSQILANPTFRYPVKPEATIPLAVISGEQHLTNMILFICLSRLYMMLICFSKT